MPIRLVSWICGDRAGVACRGLFLGLLLASAGWMQSAAQTITNDGAAGQQNPEQIQQAVSRYEAFLANPAPGTTASSLAAIRVRLGTGYFLLHRYPNSLKTLAPIVGTKVEAQPAADANARLLYAQAWLLCGLDHLELNEAAEAVAPLRRALALDKTNANARLALGDALARIHRMGEAEDEYEQQLRLTPSLPDAWYKLGMVHVQLAADWKRVLNTNAEDSILSQELNAETLLAGDANWDAARVLLRLARTAPDQPSVHADLGRALLALGYAKTASDAFRRELALDPENPTAMLGLAEGVALADQWTEANTELDALARSQPQQLARLAESAPPGPLRQAWTDGAVKLPGSIEATPEGIFWRTWLTISTAGSDVLSPLKGPAETCAAIPAAEEANPGEWLTETCYRRLGEKLKSRQALSAAGRAKLAETLFRLGEYREAMQQAEALRRLHPHDEWAMYWLSRAHAELAGDCFVRLALLNAASPRVHQMLAERYLGWGQFSQAETEYKTAIGLAPNLPDLYLGLGDAYTHMLDWASAVTQYKKTLELAPGSVAARAELGHAYAKMGEWQPAIAELRQIPADSPQAAAARLDLANAENEVGNTRQAIADLLPYSAQDKDGEIHFRLAVFYRRIGDADAAKQATQAFQSLRAAQLAVSHDEIQALEDDKAGSPVSGVKPE